MSTGRKLVSDVRGMHKLLSTDALITDRVILSELRNVSSLLIKRETNLRKLWATDTLFTTIPCLEMIEVPISECCNFVDDCTIARTKFKIPQLAEGNYQYVIQGVYSINALSGKGKKLKEIYDAGIELEVRQVFTERNVSFTIDLPETKNPFN